MAASMDIELNMDMDSSNHIRLGVILERCWGFCWGGIEAIHRANALWPLIGLAFFAWLWALKWSFKHEGPAGKLIEAIGGLLSFGTCRAKFRHAMLSLGIIPDLDVSLINRWVCKNGTQITFKLIQGLFPECLILPYLARSYKMDQVILGARQCGMCGCQWCR